MSRRFCGLVLCGLACSTAGWSTNAVGADHPPVQVASSQIADEYNAIVPPQLFSQHGGELPADYGIMQHHAYAGPVNRAELELVPPGTLGETYTRVSYPVPLDKHPRTGMLAVKDNGKVPYMTVAVMGGLKMKNGIWLFESTRPLDPGVCQIVRVEARETPQDISPYATRFVRLIPGRIVFLEF